MARRKRGLVHELAAMPWWVGLLFGGVGYVALAHVLPNVAFENLYLGPMAKAGAVVAPFWAFACCFAALLSFLNSLQGRSLYDAFQRLSPNLSVLSWREFERMVGEHFRRRGFSVSERGGVRPDGGVDLVARRGGERYLIQCKHWRARQVGVATVRELMGSVAHEGASGGFLVTSGRITTSATRLARDSGIKALDGKKLAAELQYVPQAGTADIPVEPWPAPAAGTTLTNLKESKAMVC